MAEEVEDVMAEDPIKAAAEEADAPPVEEPKDDKPEQPEITADHGIEALKLQIEQERNARIEAERRAHEAQRFAQRSEVEVQDSNLQLVVSAIETVKRDNMMNRRAYAEAMQAQDFEKAAEIQDIMAMNNAKLLQLENGRVALEQRVREAQKAPPAPPKPADPVEAIASQLSPKSAEWIRRHPECVRDQRLYMKMIGAHNIAVADGLVADSPEYFDYIEGQLGYKKASERQADDDAGGDDPMSAAAKPAPRRAPPPAAPPSRASGSGGRGVTLTAAQREAAAISGLTEEEYARNLAADKKRRTH